MNTATGTLSPGTAKKGRKLLAMLLSLCMALALLPTSVFAVGGTQRTTRLDLDSSPATDTSKLDTEGWAWYKEATEDPTYGSLDALTLVLDGLNLSTSITQGSDCGAVRVPDGATVLLAENSVNSITLSAGRGDDRGLYTVGDMTVKALGSGDTEGELTINLPASSTSDNVFNVGVMANNNLTIESGNITVNGGSTNTSADGQRSEFLGGMMSWGKNVVITGGHLTVHMGTSTTPSANMGIEMAGISGGNVDISGGVIAIDGGSLTTTGGAARRAYNGIQAVASTNANLSISGAADITVGGTCSSGLYSKATLTIQDGTLDITGGSAGAWTGKGVTITGGNIALKTSSNANGSGICSNGGTTINGGTVRLIGGYYAISGSNNALDFTGMSVKGSKVYDDTDENLGAVKIKSNYLWTSDNTAYIKTALITPLPAGTLCILDSLSLTDSNTDAVALSPTFDKSVTYYTATVPNDIESVTIAAVPFGDATIDDSTPVGVRNLNVGANELTVRVNLSTEHLDYVINVVREGESSGLLTGLSLIGTNGGNLVYDGTISGLNAAVAIADGMERTLKVDYTVTDGTTLYQNYEDAETPGTEVVANETVIDFTNPVTLTAVNGATSEGYTVTVTNEGAGTQVYGLALEAKDGHHNVGESVDFDVYATAPHVENLTSRALDIGSYQFTMKYDSTNLSFSAYTPTYDGSKEINSAAADRVEVAMAVNRGIPMVYEQNATSGYDGRIKLGTVSFTVKNTIPEAATLLEAGDFGILTGEGIVYEVTPNGYNGNAATLTAPTAEVGSVYVHNHTITFQSNAEGTATVTGSPVKAYVKYDKTGIWTGNDYATAYSYSNLPTVTAAQYYRADGYWAVSGNSDFNNMTLGSTQLTSTTKLVSTADPQNLTATPTAVQQVTATFAVPESMTAWGTITPAQTYYPLTQAFDVGTTFTDNKNKLPVVAANSGYKFMGWSTDQTEAGIVATAADLSAETDDYELPWGDETSHTITYYAIFAHQTYNFDISGLSDDVKMDTNYPTGLTDGHVVYGDDVVIKIVPKDPDNKVIPYNNIVVKINDVIVNPVFAPNTGDVVIDPETDIITIDGDVILGDVKIDASAVEYHTIAFATGNNATVTAALEDLTYFAVNNAAGLYDTLDDLKTGTLTYTAPTAAADQNYRLDNQTAAGQYWVTNPAGTDYTTNGIFGTTGEGAILATQAFTADATLYAKTVQLFTVTFASDANASLTGESGDPAVVTLVVDSGHELTAEQVPAPGEYPTGYEFDAWNNGTTDLETPAGQIITSNITFTLKAKLMKYDFTSTTSDAFTVTPGTGIAENKVTHGQSATFTVTQAAGYRITGMSYTVGGGEPVTLTGAGSGETPFNGEYTIPGESVTGAVAITIETAQTTNVTFWYWDQTANGGTGAFSASTTAAVIPGETLTQAQLDAATALASPNHPVGKKFLGWAVLESSTVLESSAILEAAVTAEANNAYTAVYGLAQRTLTDEAGLVGTVSYSTNHEIYQTANGVHPTLVYHTDGYQEISGVQNPIIITPVTTKVVTELFYAVQNPDTQDWGDPIRLTPDASGKYYIPGTAVTGDVRITGTVLATEKAGSNPSIEFISRADYKALTGESAGRKILVLNGTASTETYTLTDGTVLYWSSKYSAHVCWVNDAETALTLATKLHYHADVDATAVSYGGDVNGDTHVTAADAQFVSDCLHNERRVPTSAMQLFRLDVTGSKEVSTADEVAILNTAVQ